MHGLTLDFAGAPSAFQGRHDREPAEPRTGRILRVGSHGARIRSVMDSYTLLLKTFE
jgi:hypothetical protein